MRVCPVCDFAWETTNHHCPQCGVLWDRFQDYYRATRSPDPTPEEIQAACERIQRTWSNNERKKRAGLSEDYFHADIQRTVSNHDGRVNRKDSNSFTD